METFEPVRYKHERIIILACGPSCESLSLSLLKQAQFKGVHVIGINRSLAWYPEPDSWFTLDPDPKNFQYLKKDDTVKKYVAVPKDYGQRDARVHYHQNKPIFEHVHYLERLTGAGRFGCRAGLAEDPSQISTGNSAYGAFGLAYHMKPKRITLLGVDGERAMGYAFMEGRPTLSLGHLPWLFATTVGQLRLAEIAVMNGSPNSTVPCFQKASPDNAVEWAMEGL